MRIGLPLLWRTKQRGPRDHRAIWAERAARRVELGGAGWLRRIRLSAGLTLFTYVLLHLINHTLGIVSLETMETAQPYLIGWVRSLPATVLLTGAALTHAG